MRTPANISAATARHLSEAEARWLAATVDCEGCILNVKKAAGYTHWRIVVGMTSPEYLGRLKEVTGVGTINRRGIPKKVNHTQCYAWQVGGANAAALLQQVLPHLVIKQEAARRVIARHQLEQT